MAIYKLLELHPSSVWASSREQVVGMVFQSREKPYKHVSGPEAGWLGFLGAIPLNGTTLMISPIALYACKVKRLCK